jgi:hypothetical protein
MNQAKHLIAAAPWLRQVQRLTSRRAVPGEWGHSAAEGAAALPRDREGVGAWLDVESWRDR